MKSAKLRISIEFDKNENSKTRKKVIEIGHDKSIMPEKEMPMRFFASLIYHILDASHAWGGGKVKGKPSLHNYVFEFTPSWVGVSHEKLLKQIRKK